jgi:hypothetical protein
VCLMAGQSRAVAPVEPHLAQRRSPRTASGARSRWAKTPIAPLQELNAKPLIPHNRTRSRPSSIVLFGALANAMSLPTRWVRGATANQSADSLDCFAAPPLLFLWVRRSRARGRGGQRDDPPGLVDLVEEPPRPDPVAPSRGHVALELPDVGAVVRVSDQLRIDHGPQLRPDSPRGRSCFAA